MSSKSIIGSIITAIIILNGASHVSSTDQYDEQPNLSGIANATSSTTLNDTQTPTSNDAPEGGAVPELVLVGQEQDTIAGGNSEMSEDYAELFPIKSVRMSWDIIPGAVSYNLVILKHKEDTPERALARVNRILNNGCEINTSNMYYANSYYWAICPLDYNGNPIGNYSEPKLFSECEINPSSPKINVEFDKMSYMPLYPVYSWIPHVRAHSYEIRILRENQHRLGEYEEIRTVRSRSNIYYEDSGYTWPGNYIWQVRALDANDSPLGDWSYPNKFNISNSAKVAALGDSITHGGGVTSVPPSMIMYNWETYSEVPIKNLGISGDTTQNMNSRFDSEVLPFSPKILVIMGGVNNFRIGENAEESIAAFESIKSKCLEHNIVPIFVTATPINEDIIVNIPTIANPASGWKYEQQIINSWIKQQKYWVDVTPALTNDNGRLKPELTTDGLHPDLEGKKIIGEAISQYLLSTFPDMNLLEK